MSRQPRPWLPESACGSLARRQPMSVLACDIFARCSIRRRLSVGATFFKAGLLKYRSREFTVKLFQDEYRVPLLDPAVAARIAMMQELTIPILLFLGLFTRIRDAAAARHDRGHPHSTGVSPPGRQYFYQELTFT